MTALKAFNLQGWIAENRHLLRPPVANRRLWRNSDFIVMVIGGPNARTDFHVDPYEEFFYQLTGDIVVRTVQDGRIVEVPVREGEVMLMPPFIPHSPKREDPESIGLVVERTRGPGVIDAHQWHCDRCATLIWRKEIDLGDIEADLPGVFAQYDRQFSGGTCPACGAPNPKRPTR